MAAYGVLVATYYRAIGTLCALYSSVLRSNASRGEYLCNGASHGARHKILPKNRSNMQVQYDLYGRRSMFPYNLEIACINTVVCLRRRFAIWNPKGTFTRCESVK